MKQIVVGRLLSIICCILVCFGCKDKSDIVKEDLAVALNAYVCGDMDTYFSCVDFGEEIDSIHSLILRKAYDQYKVSLDKAQRQAISAEPTLVSFVNDSVAYVYYNIRFQDGSEETCSHKMVRSADHWKIRIRD